MRIAVWYNLPSGGGKRALHDQVRGLLARGHQVEVWCPPTADRSYLRLGEMVREHVVPLPLSTLPKSGLSKLRLLYWHAPTQLRAMERHCGRCAEEINASGFDLLFAASCRFFATTPIGRFSTIPSVLYLQEPGRRLYESWPQLPWLAPSWTPKDWIDTGFWRKMLISQLTFPGIRIQGREERRNAQAFDDILVNSYFSRESVLRAYGLDSKVCYLGVDADKFVDHHRQREPIAVSIGAFVPEKGVEFIIRAVARVTAAVRPKLCWIANIVYPGYDVEMRRLAADHHVDLELKYRLPDSEMIDILNRARMMLYAPRLEPFGFAPLEANACGLPVIAVAEGGVRETVDDGVNGILVEHDAENMASAIQRLALDDTLAASLGQNGRQLVQTNWSLPSSIERLESRLKATLGRAMGQKPMPLK